MNKISTNVSRLLYDNVVADDVLKVYRSINNFSIVSKEVVDLENNLIINSFFKNKFLFNSKYLYYKLSFVLKDMGLCIEKEQIENKFIYLLSKSYECICANTLDDFSKIEHLNQIYLSEFYKTFIDQPVTTTDIIKVHRGISLNNQAFKEIILLEKRILVNSIKNNQTILSNKLAYYKLAMQIKGLGLKINNQDYAKEIFDKVYTYTNYILDIDNIDMYTKLNILDFLYFKLSQVEIDAIDQNLLQFNNLNNEIKGLIKQDKNSEDIREEKKLVYAILKKYTK